ncbi:MAG: histidine phosphatase family protein [Clostridia bacterium]|nr:histidine phosphatase family protein [Clostridia bacterium]
MKSYVVHLIRHGTSEGNLEGKYIGRTESPIASEGIQEILTLKREYGYPKVEAHYASPSTRCVDTLKIIYPEADPEVILEMAECDFGDFENRNIEELKKDPKFIEWINNGQKTPPPNGESSFVFMQRVCKGFEMMVQNMLYTGTKSAALVTHGGVIMTILAAYGIPKAKMTDWMCAPGCGYSIRITPNLWSRSQVVEVFDTVPLSVEGNEPDNSIIDIARDAADALFGSEDE